MQKWALNRKRTGHFSVCVCCVFAEHVLMNMHTTHEYTATVNFIHTDSDSREHIEWKHHSGRGTKQE